MSQLERITGWRIERGRRCEEERGRYRMAYSSRRGAGLLNPSLYMKLEMV